jgi:hypothetical protein
MEAAVAGTRRKPMRALRPLIAAGLVIGSAAFPIAAAATASAAVTPVIYNDAAGWHDAAVRPKWVIIGEGGTPNAHTWHWSTWDSRDAISAGTLWVDSCLPNCAAGRPSYHKLTVTLSHVKYHDGHAYFSVMTWYTPGYRIYGYKTSTATFRFNARGFWQ